MFCLLLAVTATWPCQVKEYKIISEPCLLTGWLAGCVVNLVFNFQNPDKAEPCNEVETFLKDVIVALVVPCWANSIYCKQNVLTGSNPAGHCHFPWIFCHFQDKNKV